MGGYGGREPKKSSLKNSKVRAVNVCKNVAKTKKEVEIRVSSPAVPLVHNGGKYFDCACAILSRKFDRDRDRVLTRAAQEDVCAIVTWFSDIDKQQTVIDTCKLHPGQCYAVVGVNPDNIHHNNKRMQAGWITTLTELAMRPECVGITTGLNLSRDVATHFAQETLFRSCCELATLLKLPLVLHIGNGSNAKDEDDVDVSSDESLDRAIEILTEEGWLDAATDVTSGKSSSDMKVIILYDALTACQGEVSKVQTIVDNGIYCMVSSAMGLTESASCNDGERRSQIDECVRSIPIHLLLACSDSPWKTPQNLDDEYLRTLRNEPCNMVGVVKAIADSYSQVESHAITSDLLASRVKENALHVFKIPTAAAVASAFDSSGTDATVSSIPYEDHRKATHSNDDDDSQQLQDVLQNLKVSSDDDITISKSTLNSDDSPRPSYDCSKCHAKLLYEDAQVTHAPQTEGNDSTSVFRRDQKPMPKCNGSIFILPAAAVESGAVEVEDGGNVLCASCKGKVGRAFMMGISCACGVPVPGPLLSITKSKLNYQSGRSAHALGTSGGGSGESGGLKNCCGGDVFVDDGEEDAKQRKGKQKKSSKQSGKRKG